MRRSHKIGCAVTLAAAAVLFFGAIVIAAWRISLALEVPELLRTGDVALHARDFDAAISHYNKALSRALFPSDRASALYGRGMAENERFKFDEAIADLNKAIPNLPHAPLPLLERGYAFQRKGDFDAALRDYAAALALDPNLGQVYYNRGLIFEQRRQFDNAVRDFEEAIRCKRRDPWPFIAEARALIEKQDLDGALAAADAALRIAPDNPSALDLRATVQRRRGRLDKARQDESALGALEPRAFGNFHPQTRQESELAKRALEQATIAYDMHDWDHAIEFYSEALAQFVPLATASATLMNRGNAYRAKGEWDRAAHDYEEAVRANPRNAGAHVNLATVYTHRHQRAKAMAELNEALRINPEQAEAYHNRAAEFVELGQFDRALADLDAALRVQPSFLEAHASRALLLAKMKRYNEARAEFDTAMRLQPKNPELLYRWARFQRELGDDKEAAKIFEQLLNEVGKESRPRVLNALGWLYATTPDEGLRNGERAVQLAKESCVLTHWQDAGDIDTLAAAQAEAGNFDAAIEFQQRAINLQPLSSDDRDGMKQRLELYRKHRRYRETRTR